MSNLKKKRNDRASAGHRPLMIAALVASGILQPLLPVLAAGTAAGQTIENTATATYTDDANNPFNATSNTVKIDVAPISGLTATPTGITDPNGGAAERGDTLIYNFDVKNVGNVDAPIFIPTPTVQNFTTTTVEFSTDGTNFLPVPPGGVTISSVAPDAIVKVRVTGTVPTAGIIAGDPIKVTLGNTGANDNGPSTQNIVDVTDGSNPEELRTTFNLAAVGAPADNKEASATQSIPFATQATPQAFSLIKKTATRAIGATPSANDDIITYNLNFSVLNTSPNGSLTPADLAGTPIKLNGSTQTKILVSDAIPEGTKLQSAPAAPSGWKTVYSTDAVDTTIPIVSTAPGALSAANWVEIPTPTPAELLTFKRVGFIADAASIPVIGSTPVDFPISVITSGLSPSGGKVDNIAQAFGTTAGGDPTKVVLDESGDNSPSNAGVDGVPVPFDPTADTGKANPSIQGIDTNGNNTGTGPKGEVNEIVIGAFLPTSDSIFNGPNGQPTASGPNDVNDDFTNVSTPVAPGLNPALPIAAPLTGTFTNTVKNPTTVTLAEVTVQPLSPTKADAADNNGTASTAPYIGTAGIPTGTLVKLTPPAGLNGQLPVVYEFNGTDFVIVPAVAGTQGTPLNFGSLAPNATVNYTTEVTLPTGTVTPLTAISIPLIAFPDESPSATPGYTNELTNNITIDRVYTGYMKLVKEARIISADKNTVIQDWTTGDATGKLVTKALSGQFIEYRVKYENISTPASGSGNVILNANNFKLVEDGVTAVDNTNNWAGFTTHQQNTSATLGVVNYFNGATSLGTTDQADGNPVTKYENVVPSIAPASQGSLQFRRLVN